jgi:photosystem II stability/assembly factor-like uncharacterized protein
VDRIGAATVFASVVLTCAGVDAAAQKPPSSAVATEDEVRRFEVSEARAEARRALGYLEPNGIKTAIDRARAQTAKLRELTSRQPDARPLRQPVEIDAEGLTAQLVSTPPVPASFGSTGIWVDVKGTVPVRGATVRFRVEETRVRSVDPGTIAVVRFDARTKEFSLLPESGYRPDLGYVFARISRPGLYTAVGVPRDPRVRATLAAIAAFGDIGPLGGDFTPKICGLILCAGGVGAATGPQFGPGGGNLCDLCLGGSKFPGGLTHLPEGDLFHLLCADTPGGCIQWGPWQPAPSCPAWVSIGPSNVPGRIHALATDPANGAVLYAGSAAGGVFKTIQAGADWTAQWSDQLSLAIGGLAVAPSNKDVLYAATGEWDVSSSAIYTMYPGYGVYRSTNGGNTWNRLSPIPSEETSAVAVDPTDPNRVFVAGSRSLHRSTDGGAMWDVIGGNTNGIFDGVISDVVIDPTNANRLFIGVHHSGIRTGGIYRSIDGGQSWTLLATGIATGATADGPRVAIGRSGAHGTKFVAVKMGDQVYTSIDGGNTFTAQTNAGTAGDGRYKNVISVDPTDESILFAGDLYLFRSTNGGTAWSNVSTAAPAWKNRIHADLHAIVFDPSNHNNMFVASDGGVYKSIDNGVNWEALHGEGGTSADPFVNSNLVTLQCWTVSVSQEPHYALAVTSHDNYSYSQHSGNTFTFLNYSGRGEGGWVEYDPNNADIIYTDNWFSDVRKTTNGTAWWQNQTWNSLGVESSNLNVEALSVAWTNSSQLLLIERPTGRVLRSTNGGGAWTPVLTVMGEEFTATAFAPSDDSHAYAATASGRVWHSIDGGATWTELARASLPNKRVHDIEVDWNDPLRVFLAFGTRGALAGVGFRQLWRGTVGAGSTAAWLDISGALTSTSLPDLGLTGLALDPTLEGTVYVSNILGVFRSLDGGDSWQPFDEGLPNTFISYLDLRRLDRTLYVSTMGRGVYRRKL